VNRENEISMKTINIKSVKREEMIDITALVSKEISSSGVENGVVVLNSLHTTGGLTVNENADPSVVRDILGHLRKEVPQNSGYSHSEGNSDAHIKTSMVGTTLNLIISGGEMVLGTWQGIYFCEFDGPRSRKIAVQIIPAE
jgi:secondary thiamine-phosphate synthase enzyme